MSAEETRMLAEMSQIRDAQKEQLQQTEEGRKALATLGNVGALATASTLKEIAGAGWMGQQLGGAVETVPYMKGVVSDAVQSGAFDTVLKQTLDKPPTAEQLKSWGVGGSPLVGNFNDPNSTITLDDMRREAIRQNPNWVKNLQTTQQAEMPTSAEKRGEDGLKMAKTPYNSLMPVDLTSIGLGKGYVTTDGFVFPEGSIESNSGHERSITQGDDGKLKVEDTKKSYGWISDHVDEVAAAAMIAMFAVGALPALMGSTAAEGVGAAAEGIGTVGAEGAGAIGAEGAGAIGAGGAGTVGGGSSAIGSMTLADLAPITTTAITPAEIAAAGTAGGGLGTAGAVGAGAVGAAEAGTAAGAIPGAVQTVTISAPHVAGGISAGQALGAGAAAVAPLAMSSAGQTAGQSAGQTAGQSPSELRSADNAGGKIDPYSQSQANVQHTTMSPTDMSPTNLPKPLTPAEIAKSGTAVATSSNPVTNLLKDAKSAIGTGKTIGSLVNLAGNLYTANAANSAAGGLSAASMEAGRIMSEAALKSAALQSGASTASAKTLSDAALQASGWQSAAALSAGGRISDADLQAAQLQSRAAAENGQGLSTAAKEAAKMQSDAATAGGTRLSEADLQAAALQSGAATAAGQGISNAALSGANMQAGAATTGGQRLADAAMQSANMQAQGFQDAAGQQVAGLDKAIAQAHETLNRQEANQRPYMKAGTDALSQLSEGLKPGGQYNRPFTMADAQNMDAYRFALDQGKEAINAAAGAGGTQLSSANLQSLGKFAEGTAAQFQQQAFNQWMAQNNLSLGGLQNMVQTGQISTGQLQQALAQEGISIEAFNKQIGEAQAAGTLGAAQARAAGVTGQANALTSAEQAAAQYRAQGGMTSANALGLSGQQAAAFKAMGITNAAQAKTAAEQAAAAYQATGTKESADRLAAANAAVAAFQAQGATGSANALSQAEMLAANSKATGALNAAQAQAAGQVGSAGYDAGGLREAAQAQAAGLVGGANATAAGKTAQANTWSNAIGNIANVVTTPSFWDFLNPSGTPTEMSKAQPSGQTAPNKQPVGLQTPTQPTGFAQGAPTPMSNYYDPNAVR